MGGGQSQEDVRGNDEAKHFIAIEYCGGWGYYRPASAIAERIEAKYPDLFRIGFYQDAGVTGRLEVTIFFNSKEPTPKGVGGIKVHSKAAGQGMGYENWKAFEKRLDDAVKAALSSETWQQT